MPTIVGQVSVRGGGFVRHVDGRIITGELALAPRQPIVPIWRQHDPALTCGEVVYIEAHPQRGVWIVAVIDRLDDDDHRRRLSAGWGGRESVRSVSAGLYGDRAHLTYTDALLREISLVGSPAAPVAEVAVSRLDVRDHQGGHPNGMGDHHRALLDRAHDYHRHHRSADHLDVITPDEHAITDALIERDRHERRQHRMAEALSTIGQTHRRSNLGHIVSVS